jgi:hypothetical protein
VKISTLEFFWSMKKFRILLAAAFQSNVFVKSSLYCLAKELSVDEGGGGEEPGQALEL